MKERLLFLACVLILITCSSEKSGDKNPLVANNKAPVLEIIGFEAASLVYNAEKSYEFKFKAFDENATEVSVSAKVLDSTGTVTIGNKNDADVYTALFKPAQKGEHSIEISVTDHASTTTGMVSVLLDDNQAPKAVISYTEVNRDLANLAFTYNFDASKSEDNDGKLVKATWQINRVTFETQPQNIIEFTFNDYDKYDVELTVEDEYGATGIDKIVLDNTRPAALFTIVVGNNIKNGETINLDASQSSSPNGQLISFRWFLSDHNRGLDIIGTTTSNSLFEYEVQTSVGTNQFGLLIEDTGSNISDTTWVTAVTINQMPVPEFTYSTSLERIEINDNTSFDRDPYDELTYSWFLDNQHAATVENERFPQFSIAGGLHDLTLVVRDQNGGEGTLTKQISVPGRPKAAFSFSSQVRNGETLTIDGSISDAGHESAGIDVYFWYINKNGFVEQLGETVISSYTLEMNHEVGEHELGLKIRNIEGLETEIAWKPLTVLTTSPVAQFKMGCSGNIGGNVSCRVNENTSYDIDPGDTITDYIWYTIDKDTGESVELTYARGNPMPSFGGFVIQLVVVDSHGGTSEKTNPSNVIN